MSSATASVSPSFPAAVAALLPDLRRRARSLERDPSAAEDLAHDTVERALRFRDSFREGSNLRAWLLCMQQNIFVSHKRRAGVSRRAYESLRVDPNAWIQEGSMGEGARLSPPVQRAVDHLPERLGSVLQLVDLDDFSYQDAALALEVPVGTVMSRLHRARARLRDSLSKVA